MLHSPTLRLTLFVLLVLLAAPAIVAANSIGVVPGGLSGTGFALEVTPNSGSDKTFVQSDHPNAETRFNVEMTIDPQTVTLQDHKLLEVFKAFGAPQHHIRLNLEWNESLQNYKLWLWVRENSDVAADKYRFAGKLTLLPNTESRIRVEWGAASGPGASNGFARFLKNGQVKGEVLNLDNDERVVNMMRVGLPGGSVGTGATGNNSFIIDEVVATR